MTTRHQGMGFTLIELLIAVAIMAIVAAVATPMYTAYSERSYRGEAQGDMMACAQGLERWASVNFDYRGAADTDGDGAPDGDAGALPNALCTPRSVAQGRYNFSVATTATGFTITADPIANMADDGLMTLDAAGVRRWDKNDDGDTNDVGEDNWEH